MENTGIAERENRKTLVDIVNKGCQNIREKMLDWQIRLICSAPYTSANSGSNDGVGNNISEDRKPNLQKPNYLKNGLYAGLFGAAVGAGAHYLIKDWTPLGMDMLAGGVIGAANGITRGASKIHQSIKPIYYGLLAGTLYGLTTACLDPGTHADNFFKTAVYWFGENVPILGEGAAGISYPGRITTENLFLRQHLNPDIAHRVVQNSGLWGGIGACAGYLGKSIKLSKRKNEKV